MAVRGSVIPTTEHTIAFRGPDPDAVKGAPLARPWPGGRSLAAAWLALIALTAFIRLPALLFPGPIDDEGVYSVVANAMLSGGMPYRDAIERKPPFLFDVYAGVFGAFGEYNWLALHLVALLWVLLTMAGLYAIGRRLFDRRAGLLAALAYSILQPWATYKNLAFNGEVLMNLPLAWAYALALRPGGARPGRPAIAAAGVLLASAFLLKQPAAIAAVPVGLYLLFLPGSWRGRVGDAALLSVAFAATLGAVALALWREGILAEAFYWTITDHSIPHVFWRHAAEHTALFALFALPLLAPLAAWRTLARAWQGQRAAFALALGWLAVSAVGAAAGARFYPHYYIQLIPPLAVLAAPVYAGAATRSGARWLSPRFAAAWLGLAALVSLGVQAVQLAGVPRHSEMARYVSAHSAASDPLFVWGQAPWLYLDARRPSATRHVATFALTGYIFGEPLGIPTDDRIVPGAWANLAADFAAHPPRFIIDTEAAASAQYPLRRYPYLADMVARNYRRVASFAGGDVYERTGPSGP
ncbi:MAG TPA: glycosyltransferase family 39 protein [Croceibacterium sp.]|nr:glycosyltransferase family 39 protein [Croceibacterium sp.]